MSATQFDASLVGTPPPEIGPLEQQHRQSAAFRAASDNTRVTPTHWHIAVANGLGWGFDGMDGVIFAIVAPFVIKEWSVDAERRWGVSLQTAIDAAHHVWHDSSLCANSSRR